MSYLKGKKEGLHPKRKIPAEVFAVNITVSVACLLSFYNFTQSSNFLLSFLVLIYSCFIFCCTLYFLWKYFILTINHIPPLPRYYMFLLYFSCFIDSHSLIVYIRGFIFLSVFSYAEIRFANLTLGLNMTVVLELTDGLFERKTSGVQCYYSKSHIFHISVHVSPPYILHFLFCRFIIYCFVKIFTILRLYFYCFKMKVSLLNDYSTNEYSFR